MSHLQFVLPSKTDEGHLDRQIRGSEIFTRQLSIQKMQRALNAQMARQKEDPTYQIDPPDLALDIWQESRDLLLEIIEFLSGFINRIDNQVVNPMKTEDRDRIRKALRMASQEEFDRLMNEVMGVSSTNTVPKSNSTASSRPSGAKSRTKETSVVSPSGPM